MKTSNFGRYAIGFFAALMLAGCGVLPLSLSKGQDDMPSATGAPGAMPQSVAIEAASGYATLYSFPGGKNGSPDTGLAYFKGLFYGTTFFEVYSIGTSGTENVLYTFAERRPNAEDPDASLTPFNGVLYGPAAYGGDNRCGSNGNGCGVIFRITTSGDESVVYRFTGGPDSSNPLGRLLAFNGKLYGTTTGGSARLGTIFSLTASGQEQVLHHFTGKPNDGSVPMGNLVVYKGVIYGATIFGGTYNLGTVFEFGPSGKERLLHSFSASEGENPIGLTLLNGTLYGAAQYGGPHKLGAIFSLTPAGAFRIVHSFLGSASGDGADPYAPPIAVNGILYGTTAGGGRADREGTIYKLTTSGEETVLHIFGPPPDGINPVAPLTFVDGALFGLTPSGGQHSAGTFFRITP